MEFEFAWKQEERHELPKEKEDVKPKPKEKHIAFLKRLSKIVKLEKENGSLANVPNSNEKMVEIQRESNEFLDERKTNVLPPEKVDIIIDCITKGFSLTDTTKLAHCSATTINHTLCNAGLSLRPPFKYRLKATQNGKIDFYARNARELSYYIGTSFHNIKNKYLLNQKGYQLVQIHKLWYQIPNNVLYSAKNLENIYLKKGINSFEDKDLIVKKEA